jgi:hypothetical protein
VLNIFLQSLFNTKLRGIFAESRLDVLVLIWIIGEVGGKPLEDMTIVLIIPFGKGQAQVSPFGKEKAPTSPPLEKGGEGGF